MKYCFFGTPHFSAAVLERLISGGLPPSLVVTNPDRPVGRKAVVTPPPVKVIAQSHGIAVVQPEKLEDAERQIRSSGCDLAILASYGKIVPKNIIDLFEKGIIVVHPSLLPKYRGATPIQSAILSGDRETGTTLILMDEKVDHGPLLSGRKLEMAEGETYTALHDKLAQLSADLLLEVVPKYLSGGIRPKPQDEAAATYTKKFGAEDAYVSEADLAKAQEEGGETAAAVWRKIRALNPEPGVWTTQNGKRVKLLEAELADGKLKLKKIQKEGGRPVGI